MPLYYTPPSTASSSGADVSASYVTIGNTGSLPNERALSASFGLQMTDGGAGSTVSFRVKDTEVATLTGSTFSGPVVADGGLSGSLQRLASGLPYLLSQGSITLITQSNGQVIISGSGGGAGGGLDESAHENIESLAHAVVSSSYDQMVYSSNRLTNYIVWADSGMSRKYREEILSYNGNGLVSQVIAVQYDDAGALKYALTESISYSGNNPTSITRTRS